ncbi:Calmodulin-binding transcription activator 4 [Acorus calamus]|uniref:Calmodulin-binding transcription activator 4 n=1 Tax=Acorus calamus TaxID=4465 RepID=A0AAV9D2E2_ACOCL|nr:Calmodulin-binding transcription activator 4 [Acorus calamus]
MQSVSDPKIDALLQEAKNRWLKPVEILYILKNHEKDQITEETPLRPPSGSIFLFNKRVLRFFRKDGHNWRKKRDGRTVGEAHERLKVENVDALNCYYAHGEQNPYFQRRIYWVLDPEYEHIALVHYREVSEGRYTNRTVTSSSVGSPSSYNQNASSSSAQIPSTVSRTSELHEPYQSSVSPGSVEEVSSDLSVRNNNVDLLSTNEGAQNIGTSSGVEIHALRRLKEQLSLDDDDPIYFEEKLPPYSNQDEESQDRVTDAYGMDYGVDGTYFQQNSVMPGDSSGTLILKGHNPERDEQTSWREMLVSSSNYRGITSHEGTSTVSNSNSVLQPSMEEPIVSSLPREEISLNPYGQPENLNLSQVIYGQNTETAHGYYHTPESDFNVQLLEAENFLLGSDATELPTSTSLLQAYEKIGENVSDDVGMLKKMNSIDWMGTKELTFDNHAYPSDYNEMWFDQSQTQSPLDADSNLTVAQNQRFKIREISPEWAYSTENSKVIITGDFLCNPSDCAWAVMFGDIEVPVEIIQDGVLRCQAPQHIAGKVTLCITSGNRESCSELRDFEFRVQPKTHPSEYNLLQADVAKSNDELLLLFRLSQMLLCGSDGASVQRNNNIEPENETWSNPKIVDNQWGQIMESLLIGGMSGADTLDWLLQEFIKDKLTQWLSSKSHVDNDTGGILSKQEQGVIHMISGLGYDWALTQIISSGVGINFRDANGWTALHWAARFGREKMVAALLAVGASPGLVTDSSPQDLVGKTPASIADAHGFKGLAGYLSELALTSHLSSLTLEQSEICKGSADLVAERAVESISERNLQIHAGATEDQLSLKDSLAAVRNAAQAAARIQSAFRAHSFRKKHQMAAACYDEYGMTEEDIHGLSAAFQRSSRGGCESNFHKAALSIQKKYRGWKGRKDYLTLRQHVVKIQAHVRGHQVRQKFKLSWTVSVLEKVILRWRRRGVGLRGYRAEPEPIDESESDDILKVFRKQKVDAAIDEALSRVLSMVDSPDARQQYRRMLESYRKAKAEMNSTNEATSTLREDRDYMENAEDDLYQFS